MNEFINEIQPQIKIAYIVLCGMGELQCVLMWSWDHSSLILNKENIILLLNCKAITFILQSKSHFLLNLSLFFSRKKS